MPMFGVREDRTAVVVVHGVGASKPEATAAGFAAAMVNTMRTRGAPAPMFEHYTFHLPLHGVKAPPGEAGALPAEDVLLRRQLDDYGGAAPNETMIVPAYAIRPGGERMPPIDVYGAWWGDIGSFGEGPLRGAVYLLRFVSRLFALGLTSVEAAADTTGTRFWYQAEWWYKSFSRLVFGVIPSVFLLNVLVVLAIAYRDISMTAAFRISLLVAPIMVVSAMLPTILRSGKSGPLDWFARPALYAIVVLFIIGLVDANRSFEPGMPLFRWISPAHTLAAIWLLTGIAVVYLSRGFVSIGTPAPRWPKSADPVPPADTLAARRTPRARFVDLTWLTTVSLVPPLLADADHGTQVAVGVTTALLITIATSPFHPLSLLRWLMSGQLRTQLRSHITGTWSRRAIVAAFALIVLGFIGIERFWIGYALLGALVIGSDVIAFYREHAFRQHALPGIGGALVIYLPGAAIWLWGQSLSAAEADAVRVPIMALAAAATLISATLLELSSRLDAWWSQPQESPAFAQTRAHTRSQRVRLWLSGNHALVIVAAFATYAAVTFARTAISPPSVVEVVESGKTTLLADPGRYSTYGEPVLKQSVVFALTELQNVLSQALVVAWGAALLIVFLALAVAILVTLRGVGRWGARRYLATTTWTSVVTTSGTIVSALLIQSLVIQFTGGEFADRWLNRKELADRVALYEELSRQDSVIAAEPTRSGVRDPTIAAVLHSARSELSALDSTAAVNQSWADNFWRRLETPALTGHMVPLMQTMKTLHEWAGVQLLALVVFVLLLAATTLWTLVPALRADTNPLAEPWGASVQLGRWATTGWEVTRAFVVLGFPALAIAPVFLALLFDPVHAAAHDLNTWLFAFLFGAGGIVAITQLGALITVLRPALALAADIEIYLRVAPFDRTPRARLLDRMLSLFSHLESSGYSRIVVVAHSQGTVIAADALRLRNRLRAQGEAPSPAVAARQPRISLITMGSPLQNLYATAFPYLYSWVQDSDADSDDGKVNAAQAGVDQWINLYKSGDYIGRYLWFSGTDDERFADNSAVIGQLSGDGKSFDTCIGYGGHTGYWSHPAVLDAVLAQTVVPARA